jgi:hypothetical protein
VQPVAVGGFQEEDVGRLGDLRIPQDGHVPAAEVPTEHQPQPVRGPVDIELDDGRPKNVPGIQKGAGDPGQDRHRLVVIQRPEVVQGFQDIRLGVQRYDRLLQLVGVLPVDELRVRLLDARRISKHDAAQIPRGRGAGDAPLKAVLHQRRDVPRMVDMRVGEDHGVHPAGIERQVAVTLVRLAPPALVEPAIQQQPDAVEFQQVLRSRDGAGRSPEEDAHRFPS